MTLDETSLGRLVRAAGYARATPLAVGVRTPSAVTFFAQGPGAGGRAVDCDSVGYAGSLAKQVSGACAVLLVQDGKLDVEASIAEWLPELPRWAGAIRVRHLVHHTAGLPATGELWDRMRRSGERDWTSSGAIAALSSFDAPVRPPGAAYAYSNVGYICLARILERVSESELGALAQGRLFGPLGMSATTLGPRPSLPASGFPRPAWTPAPLSVGDGGLWTSARDLVHWNDALLSDTLGAADALHATGFLDDGTPLDYAWGVRVSHVDGRLVQSHGGSWEDASAKIVRIPDLGSSFAALAAADATERMMTLSTLLLDALLAGAAV